MPSRDSNRGLAMSTGSDRYLTLSQTGVCAGAVGLAAWGATVDVAVVVAIDVSEFDAGLSSTETVDGEHAVRATASATATNVEILTPSVYAGVNDLVCRASVPMHWLPG